MRNIDMEVRLSDAFANRFHAIDPRLGELRRVCSVPLVVSAPGTIVEKALADCWAKGTFDNPIDSLDYHFAMHGAGRTLWEHMYEAARFFEKYSNEARWGRISSPLAERQRFHRG